MQFNSLVRHGRKKTPTRNRKDNFIHDEIIALIQSYARSKETLQGRLKSTLSNRDKKQAWYLVTADVNAVSKSHRSAAELEKKWKKLASDARADLARRKQPGTGGGPPRKEGIYTDLIADVFGDESALIDGVEGGIDVGDESALIDGVEGGIDVGDDGLFATSEVEG